MTCVATAAACAGAARLPSAARHSRAAVRIRERGERYLGAAERERVTVVIRAARQRVEAESAQLLVERLVPDERERAHRGYVERRSERSSQRHFAAEAVVVVLGHVKSRRSRHRKRRIVDDRGRGQQPPLERKRVQERLAPTGLPARFARRLLPRSRRIQPSRRASPPLRCRARRPRRLRHCASNSAAAARRAAREAPGRRASGNPLARRRDLAQGAAPRLERKGASARASPRSERSRGGTSVFVPLQQDTCALCDGQPARSANARAPRAARSRRDRGRGAWRKRSCCGIDPSGARAKPRQVSQPPAARPSTSFAHRNRLPHLRHFCAAPRRPERSSSGCRAAASCIVIVLPPRRPPALVSRNAPARPSQSTPA